MSKTIEVIMRHMAPPPSRLTDQSNRVEKLEKEITVKKGITSGRKRGSCAPCFRSFQYPSRLQWNGSRRQKRTGPDDADPTGRDKGVDPYRRTRCGRGNARGRPIHARAL